MKLSWEPLKNAAAPGCTGRKASASRSGDASKRRLLADEIVADTHDLAGEVGDHVGVEVAVRDNCARVRTACITIWKYSPSAGS
jgi:hypothetical protein